MRHLLAESADSVSGEASSCAIYWQKTPKIRIAIRCKFQTINDGRGLVLCNPFLDMRQVPHLSQFDAFIHHVMNLEAGNHFPGFLTADSSSAAKGLTTPCRVITIRVDSHRLAMQIWFKAACHPVRQLKVTCLAGKFWYSNYLIRLLVFRLSMPRDGILI